MSQALRLKIERVKTMQEKDYQKLEEKAKQIRHDIVDMVGGSGKAGHLGGSCSSADLVAALYFYKMKVNPENPDDPNRDRFLLSKGHAALVQYAALAELNYFDKSEIYNVKTLKSMLQGHPDRTKTPGIEANTGSLGQGLSIGVGIALGLKMDNSKSRVYVIMGDGELAEGQIWEAATAASNYKLDNLVGIVDANGVQATGPIKERFDVGDLIRKWEAFGWHVIDIDGHNMREICDALDEAETIKGRPTLIHARTVKGKGVHFAEGQAAFHNAGLTQEQYEQAHRDIDNN
ncbi:MAG TPA: transketolase [Clostridiales bacterium]|nr:transketolase [Clostridiales bacterium]